MSFRPTAGMPYATPDDLLTGLDDEQRRAATALVGPVCILAGAGTGKTRAITHRLAYGVATGTYRPERTLALTFTARAAGEMRSRLRALGAESVQARTFHSAAMRQLGYFWPRYIGGELPGLVESKVTTLAHSADRLGLRLPQDVLRDVAAEIEWRKVSCLTLHEYELAARTRRTMPGGLEVDEVIALHEAYEALKTARRRIDFEDIMLTLVGMLENEPAVQHAVHEQYRVFTVDEYQDVSPVQQRLLEAWVGTRQELCVVGDPSQTIYSFTGATSEYLQTFVREHQRATLVKLVRNYRSTPAIIAVANELMRGHGSAFELRAAVAQPTAGGSQTSFGGDEDAMGSGPSVTVESFETDVAEARAIARAIQSDLAAGTPAARIAVLMRTAAQSAVIERELEQTGIAYRVHGERPFFERPIVKKALLALRGASVQPSEQPLFQSVSDVLRTLGWRQQPPEARGAERDDWAALDAIMGLADTALTGTSLRTFTHELLARAEARHEPEFAAITLSTMHAAKGLEWQSVHLAGVSEGLVPISYATSLAAVDEERRLLYVAVTRARHRLRLTWAERGITGSARGRSGRGSAREPSRFLREIDSRTTHASSTAAADDHRSGSRAPH